MALLLLAACLPAGCFTSTTTQVRLVAPTDVALRAPGLAASQDLIAPGPPQTAVVGSGEFLDILEQRPYEIVAVRDTEGALRLDCEACGAAGWPHRTLTGGSLFLSPLFGDAKRDHDLGFRAAVGVPTIALGTAAIISGLWTLLVPAKHHRLRAP